jgi:hypothetical protein
MSHDDRDQRGGHHDKKRRRYEYTDSWYVDSRRRTRLYGRTRTEGERMWHCDVANETDETEGTP